MQKFKITYILVVAIALLASCDWGSVSVAGIVISEPEATTYFVGDTVEVTVNVTPADAMLPEITWTSEPVDIVSVEETTDGATITALAPGEVTITATSVDGTVSDTLTLTIEPLVVVVTAVSITLPVTTTYTIGDTVDLTATVSPSDATQPGLTWTTSDTDIATIAETTDGVTVTAVGIGTVDITATSDDDGTIDDTITLTIEPIAVTGVAIDSPTYSVLGVGGSETLTATVTPADATNQTVLWSSSDANIATVDSATGEVTGVATGTVTVTATTADGDMTDTVDLTIASVEVTTTGPVAFNPGDEQRIEMSITPADADFEYSVTVGDTSLAHVVTELFLSDVFRLIGLAQGSTTVTVAAADNPLVYDTIDITVGVDTEGPKLDEFGFLVDDDTIQLEFTELMDTASLETTAIYEITVDGSPVTVTGATVVTPENPWYGTQVQVDLATAPGDGAQIGVTVTGGQDLVGNVLTANTAGFRTGVAFGSIDESKLVIGADGTLSFSAGGVTMNAGYSGFMVFAVVPVAPDTNEYVLAYNTVNGDGSVDPLDPFPSNYTGKPTVNENFKTDFLQTDGSGNAVFRNYSYGIGFSATNTSTSATEFAANTGIVFDVTTGW